MDRTGCAGSKEQEEQRLSSQTAGSVNMRLGAWDYEESALQSTESWHGVDTFSYLKESFQVVEFYLRAGEALCFKVNMTAVCKVSYRAEELSGGTH